jgi:hypothetical protein
MVNQALVEFSELGSVSELGNTKSEIAGRYSFGK